jgi:N-dimethylarginine dimethylaminohydrolase
MATVEKEDQSENKSDKKIPRNPSQIDVPAFLMNFPFTFSIESPNNVWMEELEEDDKEVNHEKARAQFLDLFNYMAGSSLVHILPSYGSYQDQVYVANLGLHLPHLDEKDTILLSNYRSEPRIGEDKVGLAFFKMMGYKVHQPPTTWEGEADLKYLVDDVYIGGYGIRSDIKSYHWMSDNFGMKIIPLKMDDDYLYHLDCLIFPLTSDQLLVGTSFFSKKEIRALEKVANIIDVPEDLCYDGATNNVRMHNAILSASPIAALDEDDERFELEQQKAEFLTKVCSHLGMEPVLFNLSEFELSGAQLSCMVMHFNYVDYQDSLL